MSNISLDSVLPKLHEFIESIYTNTEHGTQIASSKNYHLPSLSDYLHIIDMFINVLVPNDVSVCCITGRVHVRWYYPTYSILVEAIPQGGMYNISIVPNGISESVNPSNTSVSLDDLGVILLVHALSSKVPISQLSEGIHELSKIREVACKKPLIKASSLPRPK